MFTASYIPLLGENVTEARSGAYMQSGHAATAYAPVLAAGVGVRHGSGWALRSVTFRLDRSDLGSAALGIVSRRPAASASLIDVLTGLAQLDYGSLRVLGQDMSTARGRSIARPQVGIARRIGRLQPACRIRGLVEHAARLARQPGQDRQLLVAAILDRLALAPWADVPVRAAPDLVVARARIAAAAVHQPSLLLIDGLLDDLCEPDQAILAEVIRELERDTALIVIGRDPDPLTRACPEVLALADGVLIGRRPAWLPAARPHELWLPEPACRD